MNEQDLRIFAESHLTLRKHYFVITGRNALDAQAQALLLALDVVEAAEAVSDSYGGDAVDTELLEWMRSTISTLRMHCPKEKT